MVKTVTAKAIRMETAKAATEKVKARVVRVIQKKKRNRSVMRSKKQWLRLHNQQVLAGCLQVLSV